jgi:hypothetical protein
MGGQRYLMDCITSELPTAWEKSRSYAQRFALRKPGCHGKRTIEYVVALSKVATSLLQLESLNDC